MIANSRYRKRFEDAYKNGETPNTEAGPAMTGFVVVITLIFSLLIGIIKGFTGMWILQKVVGNWKNRGN